MTKEEIKDAIISDMERDKRYKRDYYVGSLAKSLEVSEEEVNEALTDISCNIVEKNVDEEGIEYICKVREPLPKPKR